MKQFVQIKALLPDGSVVDTSAAHSSEYPWDITFNGLGILDYTVKGKDLFSALATLRKHIESLDCRLLCAGARRDVHPSGMARSMGGARKAYIFELGKPAHILVDIFSEASKEQVSTVDEQEAFHKEWIESLRSKIN
jgi:hypothetical protein